MPCGSVIVNGLPSITFTTTSSPSHPVASHDVFPFHSAGVCRWNTGWDDHGGIVHHRTHVSQLTRSRKGERIKRAWPAASMAIESAIAFSWFAPPPAALPYLTPQALRAVCVCRMSRRKRDWLKADGEIGRPTSQCCGGACGTLG